MPAGRAGASSEIDRRSLLALGPRDVEERALAGADAEVAVVLPVPGDPVEAREERAPGRDPEGEGPGDGAVAGHRVDPRVGVRRRLRLRAEKELPLGAGEIAGE